jgi:pyridoxal biosynthesis lyase PdxS
VCKLAKRSYPTLPLLAAAGSKAVDADVALLTERGREGIFVFSTSNLSARVKTDPAQGVLIASARDVTGA